MISSFASQIFALRMIFSENLLPPRIKSGAGFFGIMRLDLPVSLAAALCPGHGAFLASIPILCVWGQHPV
jgi:hypothetical protein